MSGKKTIKVPVDLQMDSEGMGREESAEAAMRMAFEKYPSALHAGDPLWRTRWENRDGEPVKVDVITVRVTLPADG